MSQHKCGHGLPRATSPQKGGPCCGKKRGGSDVRMRVERGVLRFCRFGSHTTLLSGIVVSSLVELLQLCEDGQCMKSYGKSHLSQLVVKLQRCMEVVSATSALLHCTLGWGGKGKAHCPLSIPVGSIGSVRADDRNCLANEHRDGNNVQQPSVSIVSHKTQCCKNTRTCIACKKITRKTKAIALLRCRTPLSTEEEARECSDSTWAFTGKQCWRCGVNRERTNHVRVRIHIRSQQRMSVALDNRTVVMKVDIHSGPCNDPPVEATRSKNE